MAYRTTNLVVRREAAGYNTPGSGLSGFWDSITGFGKDVLTAYGESKKTEGAAAVVNTPAGAVVPGVTPAVDSGPSMGTIVVIGAVGIGALLLLKKRKK